jgi:hypothetical protein
MNRRSFFASIAAIVVAPKVLKTIPTGTENYVHRSFRYSDDHDTHVAAHLADLRTNDWVDVYAIPDHPHLEAARRIAMLRHVRQHELAANRFVS